MKYTEDLLPPGYTIVYENFNYERKRVIVTAKVRDYNGCVLGKGAAICAPMDEYDEERGMFIAAGRAIKNWHATRPWLFPMDEPEGIGQALANAMLETMP